MQVDKGSGGLKRESEAAWNAFKNAISGCLACLSLPVRACHGLSGKTDSFSVKIASKPAYPGVTGARKLGCCKQFSDKCWNRWNPVESDDSLNVERR